MTATAAEETSLPRNLASRGDRNNSGDDDDDDDEDDIDDCDNDDDKDSDNDHRSAMDLRGFES